MKSIFDNIENENDIRKNYNESLEASVNAEEDKSKVIEAEDKDKKDDKKPDISGIIGEVIDTDWSKDNESQMKVTQLLKGIATSEDPKSNKFMQAIDKFTSGLKKEDF